MVWARIGCTRFPLVAIVLANTWHGTAFSMLVYRAALADVPRDIAEAALMDGARGWQRLAFITLPLIRSSIATNLMLITLQTLAVFTLIWVMTAGGPRQCQHHLAGVGLPGSVQVR